MSVRQRAASALGYVCLGLAASALLLACEPGDAPACAQEELQRGALCEPADARLRPQVRAAAQGELDWGSSAVEPLMIGHSAELRLDLDLDADKLRSRVTVLALAPAGCPLQGCPARGCCRRWGSLSVRYPLQHPQTSLGCSAPRAAAAAALAPAPPKAARAQLPKALTTQALM